MNYKRSFTLLEAIVAIYVFLLGIVGAMTLANQGLSSAVIFKDQLIASNLAQEGAELVRAMRDSDFLTSLNSGNYDFPKDPNETFKLKVAPPGPNCRENAGLKGCRFTDPTALDLAMVECAAKEPGICTLLKRDPTSGRYQYSAGSDTKFDRHIYVTPRVSGGRTDFLVHVIVTWKQRVGQGKYEVTTQLTPWH